MARQTPEPLTVTTEVLSLMNRSPKNAGCTKLEVMENELLTTIKNLCPLLETPCNTDCTDLEVMETEPLTKTTEDSNLMPERQQNADSTEMEDSDLQPEFSSSDDDNEIDPDFD